MIKRFFNVILLAILVVLVLVYALTFATPGSRRAYIPGAADEQRALAVHERLNLAQSAPVLNTYSGKVELEGSTGGFIVTADQEASLAPISTMGATDCQVRATLGARYGEIEGVTTTVYDLDFEGTYLLSYPGPQPTIILQLVFPFPQGLDTLNQVYFLVNGKEPPGVQYTMDSITWWAQLEAGEEQEVVVRYRARGVGSFRYAIDHNRRLETLDVEIAVQGLTGSEVPEGSLPTTAVENAKGEQLFVWRYDALIADRDVQVTLPIQTGSVQRLEQLREPLRRFAQASPLFIILFVACLAAMHRLSGVQLPPLHYLLAGLGFFLFYPTLTFLCYVLDLNAAATVAFIVVTALQVFFLGRAAGWRKTGWQTLVLCIVFLGLFSLGSMSRLRGLLFTAGGLLLVGAFMALLARYRPPEPPEPEPEPEPAPLQEMETEQGETDLTTVQTYEMDMQAVMSHEPPPETVPEETFEPSPLPPESPPPPSRYCPHCGGPLDQDFSFCPACGYDAKLFRRCPACDAEHYVPPEAKLGHCPACGEPLTNLGVLEVNDEDTKHS